MYVYKKILHSIDSNQQKSSCNPIWLQLTINVWLEIIVFATPKMLIKIAPHAIDMQT